MNNKPNYFDVLILSCFVVFITFQPYLFHHEIIMMESGIHLPGIQALLNGGVPYRDFLYLRGPLELYVPALFMIVFGPNMIWLPVFYYVGTILTMILVVVLAFQICRTKLVFYLAILVFTARTFPRIAFYYWGGMRYALGMLVLVLAVKSFTSRKASWMFGAGIISCLAFWTTVEAGIATIFAVGSTIVLLFFFKCEKREFAVKMLSGYVLGIMIIFIPAVLFMGASGALIPYMETTYIVLTKSFRTFRNGPGLHPVGVTGFLRALIPGSEFFKSMTPVYFYVIFFVYLAYRRKNKTFNSEVLPLIVIAFYGIVLYAAGFRRLDGHHFEMALQPEKILFFFILEEVYLFSLKTRAREIERAKKIVVGGWRYLIERKKAYLINFLIFAFVGSSLGYAFTRYYRRFVMVKYLGNQLGLRRDQVLSFLRGVEKRPVNIERAKGMVVPVWQAEEMEGIVGFLKENTGPGERVFTYPELGNFNFWADRPFVGRFPIATFSWMEDSWHQELVADFKDIKPRYVIMTNLGHRTFPEEWYFRNKTNIRKFNEITKMILDNYTPIKTYESVSLYERN